MATFNKRVEIWRAKKDINKKILLVSHGRWKDIGFTIFYNDRLLCKVFLKRGSLQNILNLNLKGSSYSESAMCYKKDIEKHYEFEVDLSKLIIKN